MDNPEHSFWVNASAGTGKTFQLVKRYLSLIAHGYQPDQIVCLTFTHNAAIEMKERILSALQSEGLEHLMEQKLRIQTIHAFCHEVIEQLSRTKITILDNYQQKEWIQQALYLTAQDHNDDIKALSRYFSFYHVEKMITTSFNHPHHYGKTDAAHSLHEEDCKLFQPKLTLDCVLQEHLSPEVITIIQSRTHNTNAYFQLFLTKAHTIRQTIIHKDLKKIPVIYARLVEEAENILQYWQHQKLTYFMQSNAYMMRFIAKVHERYHAIKRGYDYKELIVRATQLLSDIDNLYAITKNLKHVLIDEAQDLSVHQWQWIRALTQSFFDDATETRSLFVVGDIKQSIYGFQGAHPKYFEEHKRFYQQAIGHRFHECTLQTNYRSLPGITQFVSKVCDLGIPEQANHQQGVAVIQCLPEMTETSTLKDHIQLILEDTRPLLSTHQPPRPQDILVLFRKRDAMYGHFIQACDQTWPIYHDQSTYLADHKIIQDTLALMRVILNPYDDYNLACFLKSALMRVMALTPLSSEALSKLCIDRPSSVWENLHILHPDIYGVLEQYRTQAKQLAPFDIIAPAMRYLQHYPPDSSDIFEKFMHIVFERQAHYTMQELSKYFDTYDIEVQHNTCHADTAMRVMTIHGAKGLESPIVILVNTNNKTQNDMFWHSPEKNEALLVPSQNIQHPIIEKIREEKLKEKTAEYQRLLYVALTRAKDRLYIAHTDRKGMWENLREAQIMTSATPQYPQATIPSMH